MTEGLHHLGTLDFASHRNGSPIKLPRSKDEVVMLACNQRNHRLVELHIFTGKAAPVPSASQPPLINKVKPMSGRPSRKLVASKPGGRRQVRSSRVRARFPTAFCKKQADLRLADSKQDIISADQHRIACELLREAAGIRGQSFMSILEVGIDDGMAYYVTNLNDGEFVQDYVTRRGAVPTVTSLALLHQLLQDLGRAEEHARLVATMGLDRVLIASQEEEYLQLRVFDYGLSQTRSGTCGQNSSRLVIEACHLLFLLMTGQAYAGGNPDNFSVIAELPTSLRFVIKSLLTNAKDHSIPIKTLRDEVREALCSLVTLAQARNPKTLLVADQTTLPISHLQGLLLGDNPLKTLFGANFQIENPEFAGCHPFAIPAVSVATEQPLTLHLLPPERIVNQSEFMVLPPQAWRQDPAKQPNLLHMLSLWKGPDWAFISELREPGMTLGSLMAKRGALNPAEVLLLLRQIHSGLEQAMETGVQRMDLDPASIQLCVGYDGSVLARDLERLHQKRLDVWPKFVVKLRLHKTMRSLCKPRLIDLSPWEYNTEKETAVISARDERHRSFIGLAAYLLTGKGQIREISEFPTGMPEMASGYLLTCLQSVLSGAAVPSPSDFTDRLHHLLTAASSESASAKSPLISHEMESAGFVSDFEEDWAVLDRSNEGILAPINDSLRTLDFNGPVPPKPNFPWLALAATLALLAATAWMILGDLPEFSFEKLAASKSSAPHKSVTLRNQSTAPAPKLTDAQPTETQPQPVIHKIPAVALGFDPIPLSSPPAPVTDLPPPLMAEAGPVPVTSKLESPAPPILEEVKLPETRVAEKSDAPSLPTPQLVATVSSITAPVIEPVTIRRAISTAPTDEKLPQDDLAPKNLATNLVTPVSSPVLPPAPASIVATQESPIILASPASETTELSPPKEQVSALDSFTVRHAIVVSPEEIQQTIAKPGKSSKGKTTRRSRKR